MAIEARVSRGYAWRMIIIAVVSLVFGLWGVYDYVIAIPRDQQLADRLQLLRVSNDALETEQTRGELTPEAKLAYEAILAELNTVLRHELAESGNEGWSPIRNSSARLSSPFTINSRPAASFSGSACW